MTKGKILLLGTNLGDRWGNLSRCKSKIETEIGAIISSSSVYETAAWGEAEQPAFLNQVVMVDCPQAPMALLRTIKNIETGLGRVRKRKWGERIIDIDILYYDDWQMESEELTIPHPEIKNRRFTLIPLVQISPDFRDPEQGMTVRELLARCQDRLAVNKIENNSRD
jgi:2-amino-4-hydroxy-6-hydroxymethyldihydropteridine diphosphokinase